MCSTVCAKKRHDARFGIIENEIGDLTEYYRAVRKIERSPEKPVIYIGTRIPPGYGRRGVALREREIHDGIERTDPPGYFYFRPDDDPSITSFVHRDEFVSAPD